MKSTSALDSVLAENYLFKDLRNCMRPEREIFWVPNTKRRSTKLELVNA